MFPWGCGELTRHRDLQSEIFQARYFYSPSCENIYRAIKYGVWSFPEKEYIQHYGYFRELKESGQQMKVYWVLCFRNSKHNYLYGIAEVLCFEPEETFRYWQDADGR